MNEWASRWDPESAWKGTDDFLAYRDNVLSQLLQVVANWRSQRTRVAKANKNLAFFCGRLELIVLNSGAETAIPPPTDDDVRTLATDLSGVLSVLPQTDCWQRHARGYEEPGPSSLVVCEGCNIVGPVPGLSGSHRYFGCDALTFIGEKIVEWRAGFPANPWPEPGVWYSAFESDRGRH